MSQLIHGSRRPTAVICLNDFVALWAWKAALDFGLQVPQDIALVGFDNDSSFSPLISNCLTTVHQPFEEVALAAMQLLIERMESPDQPFRQRLFLRVWSSGLPAGVSHLQ